jgi:hypothetical protein
MVSLDDRSLKGNVAGIRLGDVMLDNLRLGVEDATALLNEFVRDLSVGYHMISGAGSAGAWR